MNSLAIAAARLSARLSVHCVARQSLETVGLASAPLDDVFNESDREALAAYEDAVNEINGARPLPLEKSA